MIKKLEMYRFTSKMSNIELADILNISPNYLSLVFTGKKNPSKKLLKRIEKFLEGKEIPQMPFVATQLEQAIATPSNELELLKKIISLQDRVIELEKENKELREQLSIPSKELVKQ